MAPRLDELFSPDRLRQNWQSPLPPPINPAPTGPNFEIHALCLRLMGLIQVRFKDATPLSSPLDEIKSQVEQAFPLVAQAAAAEAGQKEGIVALLEQLEELLWAMELSDRQGAR